MGKEKLLGNPNVKKFFYINTGFSFQYYEFSGHLKQIPRITFQRTILHFDSIFLSLYAYKG